MKTPKFLKDINKTRKDLDLLNEIIEFYGIDIYYIPKKGWRAFRIAGGNGICNCQTCWMGEGVILSWFDDPHLMAEQFIKVFE